jgi:hypothetical protein
MRIGRRQFIATAAASVASARFAQARSRRRRRPSRSGLFSRRRAISRLRAAPAQPGELADDDPAWATAKWLPCALAAPPADWSSVLPAGVASREVLGFGPQSGAPLSWPLRYSMISWSATLPALERGSYELRARAVDLNGFAQPEPRPMLKAGKNAIPVRRFTVA